MTDITLLIIVPAILGLLLFLLPEGTWPLKGLLSLLAGLFMLYIEYGLFSGMAVETAQKITTWSFAGVLPGGGFLDINLDPLAQLMIGLATAIAVLILLFSLSGKGRKNLPRGFYSWFLITLACAIGALLADHLLTMIFFWGILGFTVFKLIPGNDEGGAYSAKKTLIMIVASDILMIAGIAIVWTVSGSLSLSGPEIGTTGTGRVIAFLALATGAFTKAGAFPFHTWLPDFSRNAPAISSSYLPASLDKILGIYLLIRLSTDLFTLSDGLVLLLLIIGVCTIIFAVFMALVQHNFKKLLGYHAVSQLGYMIVGITIGTPLAVAAGLFHMVNNAIYKSGLFLTAATVEDDTGTADLDKSGGLAKSLPLTFTATLIFALSISGIPPLNGFASKWMIYQSIIDFGQGGGLANQLWIVWLALAVFGSALTLASFIKFTAGIFLGSKKPESKNTKEHFLRYLPLLILAIACIGLGLFATEVVKLGRFSAIYGTVEYPGIWDSGLILTLVIISIILGFLLYGVGKVFKFRRAEPFTGGEKIKDSVDFPVTGFYESLQTSRFFGPIYVWAERRYFDIYHLKRNGIMWCSHYLSAAHKGILSSYIFWMCTGMIILMLWFML